MNSIKTLLLLLLVLTGQQAVAQIVIGGNVYGGGNAGDTGGSTAVTVLAGDVNAVFGGARMADVGGSAFVHIDGEHASNYIVINKVYGGNDIAGTIGSKTESKVLPDVLTQKTENGIDNTWDAYVRISSKSSTPDEELPNDKKIYIGQLFGGGNGDYDYVTEKYTVDDGNGGTKQVENPYYGKTSPVLGKTYLEILGGSIVYAYGGGNNATVTAKTVISLDNPSKVVNSIIDAKNRNAGTGGELLTNARFEDKMDINTTFSYPGSAEYQIGRLFGGNNKAEMKIRPRWNLKRGRVRMLYGGGNEGRMTSPEGLLLEIKGAGMVVDNVYGGCRKADVRPLRDGTPVTGSSIQLDPDDNPGHIPGGYAARVRVLDGDVNNVYGGNDISGNVYGGNTVGIFTNIHGNVYGGGNGSYAYTDNPKLKDSRRWGDFYYSPKEILNLSGDTFTGEQSAEALNIFRPNAEKVSVIVRGTPQKTVSVEGALYVGGNSASLRDQSSTASSAQIDSTHIKIGSYVIIDQVFLGNNGENMIKYGEVDATGHNEGVLRTMARTDLSGDGSKFNSINLKTKEVFAKYMEGCAMKVKPTVLFESTGRGDPNDYKPYSTQFGSFYCGGNVGSIIVPGKMTVDFEGQVIIYDKVVGGCNNANVYATTDYNAEYLGGILGDPDPAPTGSAENAIGDKLVLNFSGLKIQPKRWKNPNDKSQGLEWNTFVDDTPNNIDPATASTGETNNYNDLNRRFKGGNIYGGCYNTGHINGNVIINLNATLVDRKGENAIFDQVEQNEGEAILYGHDKYKITERRSGVILDEQGMDVLGKALNVFGGGYGAESEIWGSTTINLNAGYTFQIFGGGEKGAVGKADSYDAQTGKLVYSYDSRYSCYVNMKGGSKGVYRGHKDDSDDMAEAEFIYGGSFEAPIAGNTVINLGNGRIFNSFAGSCNADILGHTETYIGRSGVDGQGKDILGFPWIRDHVYGGNDLGGQILNNEPKNFISRVSDATQAKLHQTGNAIEVTKASAYMEYIQGRVDYIFGGCYGDYNYTDNHFKDYTYSDGRSKKGFTKPRLDNAFVNIRPNDHADNALSRIFGAGQGSLKGFGVDSMQNRSYVLIDISQTIKKFHDTEVFGAGANCGLGMGVNTAIANNVAKADTVSAIIDLVRGQVKNIFGGSYQEGVTRRSVINVPVGATVQLDSIFGGAYGVDPMYPCDVYEAQVNYRSADARVKAIFGGNNSADRTLYGQVNISAPVYTYRDAQDSSKDTYATIFGAGFGKDTWSQYTEVNLLNGAQVWEVYGGGNNGKVLNTESLAQWRHDTGAGLDLSLPGYENTAVTYKDKDNHDFYLDAGLTSSLAHAVELDGQKYNANVHIYQGATVLNYAYGGGLGADAVVSGATYIDLLGGTVIKDLYAAGTSGPVLDFYKAKEGEGGTFTASSTAYIEGGTARNVYGGGWAGDVGYHDKTTTATTTDIPGETYVYIGIRQDQTSLPDGYGYYKGVPAIQRNAYAGGEGGSVFGESHLVMNNGYIGFTYDTTNSKYEEKLHDETWTDHVGKDRLSDCGNLFGGGYDDNSSVDFTNVTLWGGIIRNSVFGGGEIATVGRGKVKESDTDNKTRVLDAIYKHGKTNIEIFNGHVRRNVFGGGKGYNILGYGGTHGFYTDGYVFGQTEVHIHGGEIGTEAGLAEGYGNVFGGGDVGFVYGLGTATNESTGSPGHVYYKKDNQLTEDCKVVIAPMLQIKKNGTSVTFDSKTYGPYDYVPTEYLNTLPADKTDSRWKNLYMGSLTDDDMEERGVHIRNAVFAGGNVSSNSESYANSITVFGNTTATLYDVYHHDFITVGTEHTGGLYGGGNLSVVNGYRELNITNYGTDYYGLDQQITLEEYQKLTNRERAYFKLEYLCQRDVTIGGKTYQQGARISEDEYNALPTDFKNTDYWIQYGFCSIYAGRLLNTIQRADFCGVFGSRLVLQGAKDRVADVADATEYTINRIGELSLNQQRFTLGNDSQIHGNYFGIYNIVNYLGALTSDVRFDGDMRRYISNGQPVEDTETYLRYKENNLTKRDRNNGTSWNQVALASGVYLELTTEMSTPKNKVYGDITGVVELDLINVKKDIEGGGYVYARNEHGSWTEVSHDNTLLSIYNKKDGDEALTKKIYSYSTTELKPYQTSGNFIHKSKRIVDDCYPNNGIYNDGYQKSPAHYWFIKGEVYIYDQVVSAYAGSAAAYSKEVKIPLTITAGSNGKLQLLNVQPSLYAYYADEARTNKIGSDGVKVNNESTTYQLNDVISWWDWHQLSQNEQKYFVKETRVNVDSCTIDGTPYAAGTYVLEDDKSIHNTTAWDTFKGASHTVKDARGETVTDLANLFRSSNNISHETGYVLTLDMNSPKDWDKWYSPKLVADGTKIDKEAYDDKSIADKEAYRQGPTYKLTGASGLYGQRVYSIGEVISQEVYNDYTNTVSHMSPAPEGQATAEPAYVALEDFGNTQAGNAIGKTAYDALTDKSKFAPAMVCNNTIQVGEEEYILMGELVSGTDEALAALAQKYKTYNNSKPNADQLDDDEAEEFVLSHLSNAYYINSDGLYGGQYYDTTKNYSAISSWSTLTNGRTEFSFNYDALDVLVDSEYHGEGTIATYYKSPYSDIKSVEYEAYYNGTGTLTYYDNNGSEHTISSGGHISREAYEQVRNDQLHYTRLSVDAGQDTQTFYIVKETMIDNGNPYAKGQDISEKDYNALSAANKDKVATVNIQKGAQAAVKYYCYETYTPKQGSSVTGQEGSIITAEVFGDPHVVPNYQKEFSIQGSEPTETTTLYVSRESNAKDVTSEKIISVVYQYTYYEADDEGEGVSLVNELHVVNIHLQLESGAPQIGQLNAPPAVLPGTTLGMKAPSVNPGLYEILTSGWEMFDSETDAQLHRNGKPFTVNGTPLYWYQNQKVFLAFYSKTYLGKTYSNYVPLTVANYHDLDEVMKDKEHHLYVDHPGVMRNSKIYIDNRDCESDATKSELDLLKDFFDLSLKTTTTDGHAPLDTHVKGCADLEFILNSNVSPKKYTDWTSIGDNSQCFEGTLHGDGYTISGLNNSLFGSLCGNVYNLGVTGTFTGAGIAESGKGYVENCWISTTNTTAKTSKPIFGNPTDITSERPIRIVNCYYQEEDNATNKYTNHTSTYGIPTRMGRREFHNGTVAYNLNGFYLNKRYHDHAALTSGAEYKYLKWQNGILSQDLQTGYYPAAYEPEYGDVGYVERRYKDGDFIYAGGKIPDAYDIRMRVVTGQSGNEITYAPIWPDDYLFFGQTLNYGYSTRRSHEELPAHITKSNSILALSEESNRVYRAPAYFRSKEMSVAHFNADAYVVAYTKPSTVTDTDLHPAYPDMTAIDFYGHGDNTWALGSASNHFYPPLLDDDGLVGINTAGQTQNLLVYEPSAGKTYDVLENYFGSKEPSFAFDNTKIFASDQTPQNYYRVAAAQTGEIVGHLVQSDLTTGSDHLLVDKQDFNCPIAYRIGEGFRMWYQRTPDRYVKMEADKSKGWEDVCLPFSVDLVTTQQKGEITHFYENNTKGHEYWLRELRDIKEGEPEDLGIFKYPLADDDAESKEYTNTFLYDYYYSRSNFDDVNQDDYQRNYYSGAHDYDGYPRSVADKPYLIGFPSAYYYEFDLSGGTDGFRPSNTKEPIDRLAKQVITFASKASTNTNLIEIGVSDDDMKQEAYSGYLYCTNYLNKEIEALSYLLSAAGDKYEEQTAAKTVPFRPYFVVDPSPSSTRGDVKAAHNIIFSDEDSQMDMKKDIKTLGVDENLLINGGRKKIICESQLHNTTDVRIVTPAGITLTTFSIQSSEYVETRVESAGVYIVYADNGKYVKKVIVR